MREILARLDRIEAENRRLTSEVRQLREALQAKDAIAAPAGTVDAAATAPEQPAAAESTATTAETAAINATRIDELNQVKVEASQKFPLRITGMALFNAFLNSRYAGGAESPVVASTDKLATAGATMRQTVLGLQFDGPGTFLGGKINGSLYMDFFGGSTASLNHLLRLRVATVELNWKDRSFLVGQDKPIVSPREPTSLSQVGVSPLTGAGNLWLWQPQARYEERLHFGEKSGLTAQLGVFQTSEGSTTVPTEYASDLERSRPGIEGRFKLWHQWSDNVRIEIAPSFHRSTSHLIGASIPSQLGGVDWLVSLPKRIEFTGMYFSGQNISNLGALRQGLTVLNDYHVIPVHSSGGWGQMHIGATERLSFNVYGGQQQDRGADLGPGGITSNAGYFANAMYRLAPNFLISLETGQLRTSYKSVGTRLVNHYDLAFAYLF